MPRKTPVPAVLSISSTNRAAVVALLDSLRVDGAIDTHDEALGALALTLAQSLDDGAGMATAAVSRELRATLAALTALTTKEVDNADIFGNDVPATVHDTPTA